MDNTFAVTPCGVRQQNGNRAVIRVYGAAGNVIETHEHKGDFKEW